MQCDVFTRCDALSHVIPLYDQNRMPEFYVLLRRISAYSGADIVLGVFPKLTAAESARDAYLIRYQDPWHEQSYKTAGLAVDDLVIERHESDSLRDPSTNELSLISVYFDGFGQLVRKIDSLHSDRSVAEQRRERIEYEMEHATEPFDAPNHCVIQTIRVGDIQSDKPDDQPVSRRSGSYRTFVCPMQCPVGTGPTPTILTSPSRLKDSGKHNRVASFFRMRGSPSGVHIDGKRLPTLLISAKLTCDQPKPLRRRSCPT